MQEWIPKFEASLDWVVTTVWIGIITKEYFDNVEADLDGVVIKHQVFNECLLIEYGIESALLSGEARS